MKKLGGLLLSIATLCSSSYAITTKEYSAVFKNYDACFILYNLNKHQIVSEYNPNNRCNQRIAPDSTFKIALSLMAFNQRVIDQHTVFKWDGKNEDVPGWNQDQSPASWLKYSVLWVSQQVTPQLGEERIKHYLAGFKYGNQDFSGDPGQHNGLTHAWLSSSLKISATEQLEFLKAMLSNELPINNNAISDTKDNLYLGKLDNGADYYGKTGSGRHGRNEREANPSQLRDGWFVGFVNKGDQRYIFVSNLTDKVVQASIDKNDGSLKPYGSQILKPITMKLLNDFFN